MPIVSVLSISAMHQRTTYDIPHMIANAGINNSLRPERLMGLIRFVIDSPATTKCPFWRKKSIHIFFLLSTGFYYSTVVLLHLCSFKSINGQFLLSLYHALVNRRSATLVIQFITDQCGD